MNEFLIKALNPLRSARLHTVTASSDLEDVAVKGSRELGTGSKSVTLHRGVRPADETDVDTAEKKLEQQHHYGDVSLLPLCYCSPFPLCLRLSVSLFLSLCICLYPLIFLSVYVCRSPSFSLSVSVCTPSSFSPSL